MRPLTSSMRSFLRQPAPLAMACALALLVAVRLMLGKWTWLDPAVVVAMVVAYPFVEWVAHRVVLHWQPRTIVGRRIDPGIARNHRDHHRTPDDLSKQLPDTSRNLATVALAGFLVSLVLPTWPVRSTLWILVLSAVLVYEWSHYLIHTGYEPRSRRFQRARALHLSHHHVDAGQSFGVAATIADRLLRTQPDREVDAER